jgi:hypothetical protein
MIRSAGLESREYSARAVEAAMRLARALASAGAAPHPAQPRGKIDGHGRVGLR